MVVTGRRGNHGHSVQLHVEEDTDIDLEEFGVTTPQNVRILKHVPQRTWHINMIILAIQFATMDHIQDNRVGVIQDGTENVATTVRMFIDFDSDFEFILTNLWSKPLFIIDTSIRYSMLYCGSLIALFLPFFSFSEVTCGHPGSISHGSVQGSSFIYNSQVTYRCNTHYKLTGGTSTRRCQINGVWTGYNPRCACTYLVFYEIDGFFVISIKLFFH